MFAWGFLPPVAWCLSAAVLSGVLGCPSLWRCLVRPVSGWSGSRWRLVAWGVCLALAVALGLGFSLSLLPPIFTLQVAPCPRCCSGVGYPAAALPLLSTHATHTGLWRSEQRQLSTSAGSCRGRRGSRLFWVEHNLKLPFGLRRVAFAFRRLCFCVFAAWSCVLPCTMFTAQEDDWPPRARPGTRPHGLGRSRLGGSHGAKSVCVCVCVCVCAGMSFYVASCAFGTSWAARLCKVLVPCRSASAELG